ncbi:MAG: glycosyltransferase family 4 protein [Halanaerobiales bacterium]
MNIAFFTDSYKPYLSGVVKSIETFSRELQERGHKVYIFAPDYPNVEKQKGIYRFISIPVFAQNDFRLAIPISNNILADIKKLKIDIIHTHSPFLMGRLARYVSNKSGVPLVFTYHTLYDKYVHYFPFARKMARGFLNKYCKEYCQSCDLLISPSDFVRMRLIKKGITVPITTIPTGIDLEAYRRDSSGKIRKEYGLSSDDRVLLYVGRLAQEKNIPFLLKVFKQIVAGVDDIYLMLVGGGPEYNSLQSEAESLNISKRVLFTGEQEPERVIDFYLDADLFVFPSLTETQGLVILEAMAGGLPVVAVDAAGSTSIIEDGENGLVVSEDEDIFARAVNRLLDNTTLYNKMQINARKKAEEMSIGNMTNKLINSYKRVLESGENIVQTGY